MNLKKCSQCQVEKVWSEFSPQKGGKDGLHSHCKECRRLAVRAHRKKYPLSSKEAILKFKAKDITGFKKYFSDYNKERQKRDPQFKLAGLLRIRLNKVLKGVDKKGSAVADIGCSMEFFREYFENLFESWMNWANHGNKLGQWSIDHIQPLSSFDLSDRTQFLAACHYTNLRPLCAIANARKGAKIDGQ